MERGIALVAGSHPAEFAEGCCDSFPRASSRSTASSRCRGCAAPQLDGLCRRRSTASSRRRARARPGVDGVYAAGDITTSRSSRAASPPSRRTPPPRRSPQAAGADMQPEPFRPVLRGLLLTGRSRATSGKSSPAPARPTTRARSRSGGRREDRRTLPRALPRRASPASRARPSRRTRRPRFAVEVELAGRRELIRCRTAVQERMVRARTLERSMSADALVVSPEEILGEVAETMVTAARRGRRRRRAAS